MLALNNLFTYYNRKKFIRTMNKDFQQVDSKRLSGNHLHKFCSTMRKKCRGKNICPVKERFTGLIENTETGEVEGIFEVLNGK